MVDKMKTVKVSSIIFMLCCLSLGERHKIKIVDEPSSYGIMNSYQGNSYVGSSESKLKMRIKPSNFSGPILFQRFVGKCFSKIDDNYKYELCPFSNVTQHEQSLRWNPYSGILGVWQEWEIHNNTFVAMVMREGDKCGDRYRSMKVFFICGKENKVLNVTEPDRCNYHMNFSTPYVCHKHAMLVYPTLNKQIQKEWGILEGELQREEITKKGYDVYLSRLFVKAGYMLSTEEKQSISDHAVEKEKQALENEHSFDSLYQCTEEYQKLKKEAEELRALVEVNRNDQIHHLPEEQGHEDYNHIMDD